MNRLGSRPLTALVALVLTGVTTAGSALVLAMTLERDLRVPLGEHLPGGGEWRVIVSCVFAGVLASMILARPIVARPRRAAAAALAAALLVGLAGFTIVAGEVTNVEFSPDRFEVRRSVHHAVPILWWRITPERTTYHLQGLAPYLEQRGLLSPVPREQARWVGCRRHRWDTRSSAGTARGLERDLRGAVVWSSTNPEGAAVLWPKVVAAVHAGDYERASRLVRWKGEWP